MKMLQVVAFSLGLLLGLLILIGCGPTARDGYFYVQSNGSEGYACSLDTYTPTASEVTVVTVPTVEEAAAACKDFNAVLEKYQK